MLIAPPAPAMFADSPEALSTRARPSRLRRTTSTGTRASTTGPFVSRALASLLGPGASDGVDAIETLARVRPLTAGPPEFGRHERARAAVLLAHGSVALGLDRGADGFEVERMAHAPAWLDLASVWLGAAHGIDARAHVACVIAELPLELLRERVLQQPALALRLIQGLAQELQVIGTQTAGLMHSNAPARLAQWLQMHAKPSGGYAGRATVELSERKRDLAAQLAIAPETLSRLLRRLVRDGVIDVAGYTVHVLDRDALERMARL
jgi:CRP-like cAMP-binding protein